MKKKNLKFQPKVLNKFQKSGIKAYQQPTDPTNTITTMFTTSSMC